MTKIKEGIKIIGNGHWIPIDYAVPEWSDGELEACFLYKGERYYLSEFLTTVHHPVLFEYDGYHSDSFFSGLVIKFDEYGEHVKVYTFIG